MQNNYWVRAADGALVNLNHVTAIRVGPVLSDQLHRVLASSVDGTDVLLFAGAEAEAGRVLGALQARVGAQGVD